MILSHAHKFIFFCSSKVGTTSMEQILRPLQEGEEYDFGSTGAGIVPKHVPPAILRGALPKRIWDEYFKFAFIRNPWDWFISQWFYNSVGSVSDPSAAGPGARPGRRLGRRLESLRHRPRETAAPSGETSLVRSPTSNTQLLAADVDGVFELLKQFKGLPGRDGLYQSNWVYDMDDRVIVDYVGRYETLRVDFDEVMRHLGLELALPHLNRTLHQDYRSYYSAEARDRVADLWALDVNNFGYTFDPHESDTGQPAGRYQNPDRAGSTTKR